MGGRGNDWSQRECHGHRRLGGIEVPRRYAQGSGVRSGPLCIRCVGDRRRARGAGGAGGSVRAAWPGRQLRRWAPAVRRTDWSVGWLLYGISRTVFGKTGCKARGALEASRWACLLARGRVPWRLTASQSEGEGGGVGRKVKFICQFVNMGFTSQ